MALFKNVNVVYYYVTDWEKAKAFYDKVMEGWPIPWSDDQIGWREYGRDNETHIAINKWDGPDKPPARGGATVTFTVDDALKTTEALRRMGVKCDDVESIPGVVTIGTFYDPEGNRIQFAQSMPPPA